jgi:hypothetical protein
MTEKFSGDRLTGPKHGQFQAGNELVAMEDSLYKQSEAAAAQNLPDLHEKFIADIRDGRVAPGKVEKIILDTGPTYSLDFHGPQTAGDQYTEWFDLKTGNAKELCGYSTKGEPLKVENLCESFNPMTGRVQSRYTFGEDETFSDRTTKEYVNAQGKLIAKVQSELPYGDGALGKITIARYDNSGKAEKVEDLTGIGHYDYFQLFYSRNYDQFQYWLGQIKQKG